MTQTQTLDLPLAPYRVLDLSDDKAFLCGRILGDLGADGGKIERNYKTTVASTIAGGASEIQRNVIARRGLGLGR